MSQDTRNTEKHTPHGMAVAGQMQWLQFPTLERIFRSDLASPIALLEQRVQKLESAAENGSGAERARARLACVGYRHALALLGEMRELQHALASQQVQERRLR